MEKKNNPTTGGALPKNVIIATIPKHDEVVKPAKDLPKVDEIKKTLDEQIKKYDKLNRLVNNRLIFLHKKEQLTNYLSQIKTEITGAELETKVCKMIIAEPSTYKTDGVTITNSLVIEKALLFIIAEIDEKVKSIEAEILTIS